MRKNIKYSASFIIIILSMVLGFNIYAEDGDSLREREGVRKELKNEIEKENKDRKLINEKNLNEFKKEVEVKREEVKLRIEEKKKEFENLIQVAKEKREEF